MIRLCIYYKNRSHGLTKDFRVNDGNKCHYSRFIGNATPSQKRIHEPEHVTAGVRHLKPLAVSSARQRTTKTDLRRQ
jgi:hypothetical protein